MVGALRDQDGAIVAGARVEALDPAGRVIGQDRSAADGTFALAAPVRPASLVVTADDADVARLAVPAAGTPVAAILYRHRAADLFPSAADVAALPAGTLAGLASVVPYRVALTDAINDRWLARERGVTTLEGLPFYRRGDGADTTSLLPDHAAGGLAVRDALAAPWYGDRGGAGVIDASLFDRVDTVRATNSDASFSFGRNPAVFAASSWDADGARQLVAARASGPLGPLTGSVLALTGATPAATFGGIGVGLRGAARNIDVGGELDLTRDVGLDGNSGDNGNVTSLVVDAQGRGSDALHVRARWRDERGAIPDPNVPAGELYPDHRDAALVVGGTRGSVVRVSAAVALAYGDQRGYNGVSNGAALAVLPTLALDAPLSGSVTVHAGFGESTLGTPGSALALARLGELALAYTDRRRLRAEVVAYAEGDGAPSAFTRGLAASLGYELAPHVSLRAWALRDGDTTEAMSAPPYPGGPTTPIAIGKNFQRDVVWLTWDAAARFDLLVRNGGIEGNVRIPVNARTSLTLGTSRRSDKTRVLTLGIVSH